VVWRAALLAGLVAVTAAGSAHAQGVTSWSAYGDEHDFITGGQSRVHHPGNTDALRASLNQWGEYGAYADPSAGGDGIYLTFGPPEGEPLQPYNHVGVQRLSFADAGHAGMQLESGGRSCNGIDGRYELRDIALDAQGRPTRLWLIYEAWCDSRLHAGYGEIRINAQVPEAQRHVAPGIVRWPVRDLWQRSTEVPVSYLGTAAPASVAVSGPHAADFPLDASGCQGATGPCDVRVGFAPTAGGARTAILRFTDTAGGVHETTLEGYAHGGTTAMDVELVREGRTVHYTPATAERFSASAWTYEVEFALRGKDGNVFGGAFGSAARLLEPGHFPGAVTTFPSPNPWLHFGWTNHWCLEPGEPGGGSFDLHELRRMHDGTMRSFDVSFTALCSEDPSRVMARGRWRFRADDDNPLPAWLVPGPRQHPPQGDDPVEPDEPFDDEPFADDDWDEEPLPQASTRPRPRVTAHWKASKRFTRVGRLVVRGLAPRALVRVRCRGPRCPFRVRRVRARDGRADVGAKLRDARLWPGSVLELRVAGEVFRFAIRRGRAPRLTQAG
jgi:hypothetical protein